MVQNFVPSRQCGLGLRPSATPACAFCFVLVFGGRLPRVDKSSSGVLVVEDEGVLDALERRLRRGEEAWGRPCDHPGLRGRPEGAADPG